MSDSSGAFATSEVPFELNVSDPRCIYDKASNRWFVTMIEYPNDFSKNHLEIAVSQTGDPTGAFNLYDIDVTHDGSDFLAGDCPCLGDQPLIGADANGFYISTNSFGVKLFEGAQIYVLSKKALATGAHTPVVRFDHLSHLLGKIEIAASIQPSTTAPGVPFAADTEFLAQSMLAMKAESQLAVWTVNNTSKIDNDPDGLTMSLALTPSQVYVLPVPAEQKAGPTPRAEAAAIDDNATPGPANEQDLDGNDQRLQQVMYRDGQLWTTVGTGQATMVFTLSGPNSSRARPPGNSAPIPLSICCSTAVRRRTGRRPTASTGRAGVTIRGLPWVPMEASGWLPT